MELPRAVVECCLKVHADCESCLMRSQDTLRSILGRYEVELDRRDNVFRISGEVDPNVLLRAVMRTGEHAQLINIKLKHPQLAGRYNHHDYNHRSYGPTIGHNYMPPPYRDAYPSSSMPYYETNDRYYPAYGIMPPAARIDYVPASYNVTTPAPPATHVPSLPYQEYNDPYNNYAAVDPCSIM